MKVKDIKDRLMPMLDDAHWAEEALEKDDNQFTRKSLHSKRLCDDQGTIWALKETVLHAPAPKGKTKWLLPGEYAILSDKSYELKANGQIKKRAST